MNRLLRISYASALFISIVAVALLLVIQREQILRFDRQMPLHEALHYEKLQGKMLRCNLCPNRCILANGEIGQCKARKNIDGTLYSIIYGKVTALHVDPIEKKPFFHVLPGTRAFSISESGCNMRCLFCQNWELAQSYPYEITSQYLTPEEVVSQALRSGSRSLAFTYNEPVIGYEFMLDTAKLAKANGLKTLAISCGYIEQEPLKELLPHLDAYKVDLKAFDQRFYDKLTGGKLSTVLETMKTIRQSGTWLEIVTLLIPGENDSEEEIRSLSKWVRKELGAEVPLHFSAFHPDYKLKNIPPTPPQTVIRAREIAREEGLLYAYTGNIAFPEGETTYCPVSRQPAVQRLANFLLSNQLKNGECPSGEKIPGIWN